MTRERAVALTGSFLFALLLTACGGSGAPFNDSITEPGLRSDLGTLASSEMRGRLVGTPEHAAAAEWVGARFDSLGLEPAGDEGSYFQNFDLMWFSLGEENRLTIAGAGAQREVGNGWTPSRAGGTGNVTGEVVFAGFGIVEPRLGYDDYAGADLTGKIVLVLEREPGAADPASPFDGLVPSEASRTWRKVLAAQQRGAAGILFTRDIQNREPLEDWTGAHADAWPPERRRIERFTLAAWASQIDIPAAQISTKLAETLVAGSGQSLQQLAAASEAATSGLGVVELPGAHATMAIEIEGHLTPARNILARVEGSDPTVRDEVVIIGAHYDHDGADGNVIFAGADDNGSGTVGVLAIAAAYAHAAENGHRPRRSVIFAIWDAEERGLLGAWYYTLSPRVPLDRTVANLNLDMIGRHQEVPPDEGRRFRGLEPQSAESNANATNLLGYSRTPALAAVVDSANRFELELKMRYDNNASNLLRRSDHWPFLQNAVPAVWFHTGLHPDYHRPGDTPDRIEYGKMTRIVRLVHQASWDVANADGRPSVEGMRSRPPS